MEKTDDNEQGRFVNMKAWPYQLSYDKVRDHYVLQKQYWANGSRFQKVMFKKKEIGNLAKIL